VIVVVTYVSEARVRRGSCTWRGPINPGKSLRSVDQSRAVTARRGAAVRARLGALSQPRYRRYWLGSLASVGAVQLVTLGQGWLIVARLGGSALDLG